MNFFQWHRRTLGVWCLAGMLAVMLAAAVPLQAQPSGCPTGMTHYWKLDETSGGPYDDYYGSTDATCTNCPAGVTGKLNGAQDFDGTNDRIDVPDDGTFDWSATSSFTIEFWMKSAGCVCTEAGFNCNQVIVGRATAANAWWIGLNCQTNGNVGKLRCYLGASADFYSTAYVNDDQWHHIVYQFDQPAGQYRLYIDGALDNSINAGGQNRAGTGPLQVGYYSTAYQYAGILDELALYSAVLPLSDIQAHYNSGSGQSYCAGNQPPVVSDIPDQTISEGQSFTTIALDDFVSDPDNADNELNWTYSGNTDLTVSIDGNRVATITIPSSEWSGAETITFTATDPGSLFDSDAATFTVTAVNDAPVVGDIPDQTISEGQSFTTISLDDYVSDPDNTDDELNWTYSGNTDLTVSIDGNRIATITIPSSEWSGAETITFTATDPGSLFDSDAATFTVTAVNDAPVVSDIPDQTISEGQSFTTIALDDFVSDPDNADNELNWTYSGNTDLTVSIDGNRIATITIPSSEWSGAETITFTATDPGSLFDFDAATFTVTAVNDAPVVSDIPDQTISEGQSFTTIALDDFVSDPDNADNELNWTYSGNTDLTVSIDGNRVATITIPSSEWSGAETITFTATDPGSLFDSDAATFTVLAEGCPPSMIHYWQMEESGSPYNDSYGTTDATCTNCPTPVAGLVGNAQEFDRLTDQVMVADDGSFDWGVSSSYTIEFWINKSSGCAGSAQGNNEVVVGRSGGGWWIGVMCEAGASQTKVRAYFGGVDMFSTTSVTDGDWHLVAFVRDNTAGQWRLYIDGQPEATQTAAGKNLAASDVLSIGWFNGPDPGKYRLGGVLDELALYSGALSPAEILNHYNLGQSGLGYCEVSVAPQITSTPVTTALGNRSYGYTVTATGTPTPVFSLTTAPAGMTIDSLSGGIAWMPTAIGEFPVEVTATNLIGSASQPFAITVSALAPLITSTPVTTINGGEAYDYDVDASADPAASYWLFAPSPYVLPPGITINPATGLIHWAKAVPGSYGLAIQAFNAVGADTQFYVLTVDPVKPQITSTPVFYGRTGTLYTYHVEASGVPAPFFYLDTAPGGMSIDSISGVISWLPQTTGSHPVAVRASNSGGDDTQAYAVSVAVGLTECPSSLQHYWRLNESSGLSYADFLNRAAAWCAGSCPTAVAGVVDGAQRFGGNNVGLTVAQDGSFDWRGTDEFTIEFWMKRDSAPAIDSNEAMLGRWGPQWWIGVNHDGAPEDIGKLRWCNNGQSALSATAVNDGLWHHIAVLREAGVVGVYIDAQLAATQANSFDLTAPDALTFGYLNTGSGVLGYLRYRGALDEVAIYDEALDVTVLTAHYSGGLGRRYCERCGDPDANGMWSISDAVFLINYIFAGGSAPFPLLTGDADCNDLVTISDCVYMINFIFAGGSKPCIACK